MDGAVIEADELTERQKIWTVIEADELSERQKNMDGNRGR